MTPGPRLITVSNLLLLLDLLTSLSPVLVILIPRRQEVQKQGLSSCIRGMIDWHLERERANEVSDIRLFVCSSISMLFASFLRLRLEAIVECIEHGEDDGEVDQEEQEKENMYDENVKFVLCVRHHGGKEKKKRKRSERLRVHSFLPWNQFSRPTRASSFSNTIPSRRHSTYPSRRVPVFSACVVLPKHPNRIKLMWRSMHDDGDHGGTLRFDTTQT
jgi:hypothetical protein